MTVAGTSQIVVCLLVGAGPDPGGPVSWPGRRATVGQPIERIAEAAGCPEVTAAPSRWRIRTRQAPRLTMKVAFVRSSNGISGVLLGWRAWVGAGAGAWVLDE